MRWAGLVACTGEERKMYKVLLGKPERKRPLRRLRYRLKDGIRMDLRGGAEWIQLALVNKVMNLQVLVPRS
jgi:hypothetical protein